MWMGCLTSYWIVKKQAVQLKWFLKYDQKTLILNGEISEDIFVLQIA